MLQHENENQDKHVESVWFPCLDEGSTPSSSTSVTLKNYEKDNIISVVVSRYVAPQGSADGNGSATTTDSIDSRARKGEFL